MEQKGTGLPLLENLGNSQAPSWLLPARGIGFLMEATHRPKQMFACVGCLTKCRRLGGRDKGICLLAGVEIMVSAGLVSCVASDRGRFLPCPRVVFPLRASVP